MSDWLTNTNSQKTYYFRNNLHLLYFQKQNRNIFLTDLFLLTEIKFLILQQIIEMRDGRIKQEE